MMIVIIIKVTIIIIIIIIGTKFADLETFACPICGAAKNQFSLIIES